MAKLDPGLLEDFFMEAKDVTCGDDIVVPPRIGEDAGVAKLGGNGVLVVHGDPITGASRRIGWLSVNISANDIAVTGVRPKWFVIVYIFPQLFPENLATSIMRDAANAIRMIKAKILGGHTEFSDAVNRPVVVSTAFGIGREEDLTLTGRAAPGDLVIMTKSAGLEAASIAVNDLLPLLTGCVADDELRAASSMADKISLVDEALVLASNRIVSSMHDPTEGGVLEALLEIAHASSTSIEVYIEEIPMDATVARILECLGVNPYSSLSSGSLIATVPEEKIGDAISTLRKKGVEARIIGRVMEKGEPRVILREGTGKTRVIDEWIKDDFIEKYPLLLKRLEE